MEQRIASCPAVTSSLIETLIALTVHLPSEIVH